MKNNLFFIMLLCAFLEVVHAQSVGINTSNPHSSAALDVTSTNQGVLVPRLTTVQRTAITSPAI